MVALLCHETEQTILILNSALARKKYILKLFYKPTFALTFLVLFTSLLKIKSNIYPDFLQILFKRCHSLKYLFYLFVFVLHHFYYLCYVLLRIYYLNLRQLKISNKICVTFSSAYEVKLINVFSFYSKVDLY